MTRNKNKQDTSPEQKRSGDIVATNMNVKPSATDPGGLDVNLSHVQTPFPPPAWLEAYNRFLPEDGPRLLLEYIAKEQAHRHERERKEDEMAVMEIKNNASEVHLGQWLGFGSVMILAVFLGFVAQLGFGNAAVTGGTVIFVALAGTFLRRASTNNQPQPNPDDKR